MRPRPTPLSLPMPMHSDPVPAPMPEALRRRIVIAAAASVAMPALLAPRVVHAASGRLTLTPRQTEGPFYPLELPADHDGDLLVQGAGRYAQGQVAALHGLLVDPDGRPLRGGVVEIWQCDVEGRYHHPGDGNRADPDFQGFGRVAVDGDGRFAFRTIRPMPYTGRTPHIHVKVRLAARELLTTQLYVEGDPGNERDGIWRRLPPAARDTVTLPFVASGDGLRADCRLVVEA